MKKELLQIQQYISIHSVLERDEKDKIAYISLLRFICEKHSKKDQWRKSMVALLKEKFIGEKELLTVEIDEKKRVSFSGKKNFFFRYKFQKYIYILLVDSLFICAFDNKKRGKEILQDICELFPRNEKKLTELFDLFYEYDENAIGKELVNISSILRIVDSNRKYLKAETYRIMITANMSAGKSTLLNALAGKKVSKTQNDACTAKIHYLFNKAGEDGLSYEWDHDLELNANIDVLMEDNEDNDSLEIMVGTRFRSLRDIDRKVCFIDTPGVNSSQNKEHRDITNDVISDDNCDLLLFLLNGENIGTDDDIKHIRYVSTQYHGKVIFLVNKLDRFNKEADSIPETIQKVKDDLGKIGYNDPKVYPISAYAAYLAKMSIYGEDLTEDELDDLNFRMRKLSKEEFQYYRYYDIDEPNVDTNSQLEVVLKNSGILSLEKMIY